MMTSYMDQIREATAWIQERISFQPLTGIILGTGLGQLVNELEIHQQMEYKDIPHFPVATVESHQGRLILGYFNGAPVIVMQGRFHYYEGYSMQQVTFPVRVMKLLGIQQLLVSNISGGINPQFQLGDLCLIEDHINLQAENPLAGKNLDELGPRFPDMLEPYDHQLRAKALEYGRSQGYRIFEGVYVSVPGPNLETRAEYRFLGRIGADCVGMSTVPEIIVARHMDIPCFCISVITDLCYEGAIRKISIEEIIQHANEAQPKMTAILRHIVSS